MSRPPSRRRPGPRGARSSFAWRCTPAMPSRLVVPTGIEFVGRESERDLLKSRLKEVEEGGRRVILLAGEPGIGKTALAADFAATAHAGGATVLYGRCDEDLGVPYQPWV